MAECEALVIVRKFPAFKNRKENVCVNTRFLYIILHILQNNEIL